MHKTTAWVLTAAYLACNTLITPARAELGRCNSITAGAEGFYITVNNQTNKFLHLDLGQPKYGIVGRARHVYIGPHSSYLGGVCSHTFLTGLETSVHLYSVHRDVVHQKFLDDTLLSHWYVQQPFSGENTITFNNDSGSCDATYKSKSEPATIRSHNHRMHLNVFCQ